MGYSALLTFAHIFIAELNIKWSSCVWERHVFVFELSSILSMLQGLNATSCWELTRGVKSLPLPLLPVKSECQGITFHQCSDIHFSKHYDHVRLSVSSMEENSNMIKNVIDIKIVSVKKPVSKMLHVLFRVYHSG